MADHADDGNNDGGDIFIYRGGRAPQHVTHVIIDESVDEIEDNAFRGCQRLLTVNTHNGIRRVGKNAFRFCTSLRRINLKSVVEIDEFAFVGCKNLESVEFGDRLETIGGGAFGFCTSLKHVKLPTITTIGAGVFGQCECITDIELSERLQTIEYGAFFNCKSLQRIAIPLKRDLFVFDNRRRTHNQFGRNCEQLVTVDIVGGIHKTVASLHMESWKTEMETEINRINQVLPNTPADEKNEEIRQWMENVAGKMDHYKAEHSRYVKEGITLLELAVWKANLEDKEADRLEREGGRLTRGSRKRARKEINVTSGADIIVKNVFPFLQLD